MANAIHIAEDHIIGGCLKDAYIADVIIAELEPIDFSHPTNRCIFNILLKLYKDNKHIDAITVFSLSQDLGFDISLEHLNELQTLSHEGVGHYVELVKESSRRRKAQATLNEAQRMLEDGDESSTVIEFIEKEMFSIMNTKVAKDFIKVGDSVDEAFEDIKMMRESSSHVMGLSTGYQELDLKTSGFHPGELIILAARPGIGKTSLAVNMASNMAFQGKTVGIFSLEMSCKQLTLRLISGLARVSLQATSAAYLSDKTWQAVQVATDRIRSLPIYIDDRAGLKALEVRSAARRLKKRYNADIFIVDYLQLMRGDNRENRQQEVSFISSELKAMAKELEVPVVALSQFNRNPESREGGMPKLSDLRESGCLLGPTIITDLSGKQYTMQELAERPIQHSIHIESLNEHYKLEEDIITKVFYSGKKAVFQLTTRSGRSIIASDNHPFLKLNGWTPLSKLMVGDRIALPRRIRTNDHNALDSNALHHLSTSDILWDELISIQPLGIKDVYDATVEHNHNFIANDIIVHNSLEQDSDVVLFLHDKTEDPARLDREVDLIIAKQRNGPRGKIPLIFKSETTTFYDAMRL